MIPNHGPSVPLLGQVVAPPPDEIPPLLLHPRGPSIEGGPILVSHSGPEVPELVEPEDVPYPPERLTKLWPDA